MKEFTAFAITALIASLVIYNLSQEEKKTAPIIPAVDIDYFNYNTDCTKTL